MYEPLSDAQKNVVKSVLFGKQKQANVINDGVVAIVGKGIAECLGSQALETEAAFVEAVKHFLDNSVANGRPANSVLLTLIGGEVSVINLQSDGPKSVYCESAGPETPKYNFGIYCLGEAPEMPTTTYEAKPVKVEEVPKNFKDLSYTAQRDFLIKAITPLVPDAVKAELKNPAEQALVGSQWYFKNN